MSVENNNSSSVPKAPETYKERGTQTPTFTPPPMPPVNPAKPPDKAEKK